MRRKKVSYTRIIVGITLHDGDVITKNWPASSEYSLLKDAANSLGIEVTYIKEVIVLARI